VANPVSHETLRRTGNFAAATITAALAIWATTSSNVLQSLFLSLSYAIHRTLWSSRWSTVHRKQLYQRSPAHPAPHAPSPPSPPPSRAPLPSSRRPRTTRHPTASATTTLTASGKLTQQRACTPRTHREFSNEMIIMPSGRSNRSNSSSSSRGCFSNSLEARRRRRRQSGSQRRRRRRRGHCPICHRDTTSWQTRSTVRTTPPPLLPFPFHRHRHHRRCYRRPSRWSCLAQRSRIPVDQPRVSSRRSTSWSTGVARTTGSPSSSTVPLEDRGSRGR